MIWDSFYYLDCSHRSESYFRDSSKLNSSRTTRVLKVPNFPRGLTLAKHSVDTASFTFPQPCEVCFIIMSILQMGKLRLREIALLAEVIQWMVELVVE